MYGLTQQQLDVLKAIFSEANIPLGLVRLFGSRALGTHHTGSDIDLALCGITLSMTQYNRLFAQLNESNVPYTVDVVVYDQCESTALRTHIDNHSCPLFIT